MVMDMVMDIISRLRNGILDIWKKEDKEKSI